MITYTKLLLSVTYQNHEKTGYLFYSLPRIRVGNLGEHFRVVPTTPQLNSDLVPQVHKEMVSFIVLLEHN